MKLNRLIYFNPQILHPLCLATAWKENIPIRLLNPMNPTSEGTYISANRLNGNMVKAVATKDSITYHPVRIEPYTPALYVHQQDFRYLRQI